MTRLLVVDVGNTNIGLGYFLGDELQASWRLATARERTADEYGVIARQLVLETSSEPFEGAIVASVVPPLDSVIDSMIRQYFDLEPIFIRPGIRSGLAIRTENPADVGADRIVNAVAAHEIYGGPSIVVDFGTATTFDLVSENAEYRGGIIAPGMGISSEALFARASRLPRIDLRRPDQLIGTNTVTSMQSGIYFGYLGLVDGILERMIDEVGVVKKVIATGGIAAMFAEESRYIEETDQELTLKGLRIVFERNRARKSRSR